VGNELEENGWQLRKAAHLSGGNRSRRSPGLVLVDQGTPLNSGEAKPICLQLPNPESNENSLVSTKQLCCISQLGWLTFIFTFRFTLRRKCFVA
jgi:hypothetical protein